jgi:hypothetical protein
MKAKSQNNWRNCFGVGKNSRKTGRLTFEKLETREMMASDVRAAMDGSTLEIRESFGSFSGNQSFDIIGLGLGTVRLEGATSAANTSGSQINGKLLSQTFTVVSRIEVNVGGGQDFVRMVGDFNGIDFFVRTSDGGKSNDNDTVIFTRFRNEGSVDVNTGRGQDNIALVDSSMGRFNGTVEITSGPFSAVGESDADIVRIDGLTTVASLEVLTGASGDNLTIKNSNFQCPQVELNTGAGADVVQLGPDPGAFGPVGTTGLLFLSTGSDLEVERDTVKIEDLGVAGSLHVKLGGGNDQLDMVNVHSRMDISLKAMGGNDRINLKQVDAIERIMVEMGENDDTLNMKFVKARSMSLSGGNGLDNLNRKQMPTLPVISLQGWELLNGVPEKPSTPPQRG